MSTPQKILQVIPVSITYTPAGGTASVFTDFSEVVNFLYSNTMVDIASQSSTLPIGKLITAEAASLKTMFNNFNLQQLLSITSNPDSGYASATDTATISGGNFNPKYGVVVFVGRETATGHTITITLNKGIAIPNMDVMFGKAQEARVAVTFEALRPDTGPAVTIAYSAV
ncbi:hypothetical protein Q0M94_19195 (plasmid) [Deinococcus radiomollis]|uniref:hypothetical protein n=1 Tax=Deinococcus radiomollis TaxID=468916 RepID=UPI003892AA61